MYKVLIFGLIFCIIHVSSTEVPGIGSCPRVSVFQNFDVTRFFGRWYEVLAYPNKLTLGGRCVYSTYGLASNNGISVYSKQIALGVEKQYLGTATVVSPSVLGVTYPAYPKASAYYNILDTDYENYAVIFSCNNYYGVVNGQNVWILSRRNVLEPQFVARAFATLDANRLSRMFLKQTTQDCKQKQFYRRR